VAVAVTAAAAADVEEDEDDASGCIQSHVMQPLSSYW